MEHDAIKKKSTNGSNPLSPIEKREIANRQVWLPVAAFAAKSVKSGAPIGIIELSNSFTALIAAQPKH